MGLLWNGRGAQYIYFAPGLYPKVSVHQDLQLFKEIFSGYLKPSNTIEKAKVDKGRLKKN